MLLSKIILIFGIFAQFSDCHIPHNLKLKLKLAKNFNDLLESLNVIYHPELTNRHVNKNLPPTAMPIRLKGGSFVKMPLKTLSSSHPNDTIFEMDEHTHLHLSMMENIRQGNDTCKLQSVCVPTPRMNDDPSVIVYPRCYEVDQCVGSCCDSVESCHPHTVNLVKKVLVEFVYVGNNRFRLNTTKEITMEEHTSCSCFDCGANTPSCAPGFVVGRSCQCECANKNDRNNCVGNEIWNAETCKCECGLKCDETIHTLNTRNCECVKKRRHHHHDHHRAMGHMKTKSDSIPKEDIQQLPKLRVGKIIS